LATPTHTPDRHVYGSAGGLPARHGQREINKAQRELGCGKGTVCLVKMGREEWAALW
jgi:hypothetical protein